MSDLCVEYKKAIKDLCLPTCASFGVTVDCEGCKFIWGKSDREFFTDKLREAQNELEIEIGTGVCPKEICREKVYLCDCPVKLKNGPIAYLGKRVELEARELDLCYVDLADCGADLPSTFTLSCTEDNNLAAVVFIDDLPEGWDIDHIDFSFPEELCFNTSQHLPTPECLRVVECDGNQYIEAIWPKCFLIHPNCNKAKLSETECFLQKVSVSFGNIDESLAIELPGQCTCGACSGGVLCDAYEIEIGDAYANEVCITTKCTCFKDDYIYVNYAIAHNCGFDDSLLNSSISFLALLRYGKKKWCDCTNSTDYVDWLMELDESVTRENATPFEGFNKLRWGKTRAGVMIQRNVEQIQKKLIQLGQVKSTRSGYLGGLNRKEKPFKKGYRKW